MKKRISSLRTGSRQRKTRLLEKKRAPSPRRRQTGETNVELVPGRIKLKSILVPMDFSPQSRKALNYAIRFAEQFGARLMLLHVVEPALYPTELGYVPAEIESMHKAMTGNARQKLQAMIGKDVSRGLVEDFAVRVGAPYLEITNAARDRQADLIVIATHGYTGLKHIFLGSTAERVIRHAPCPVLTVREREHDFV